MTTELGRGSTAGKALDRMERAERRFYLFAVLITALELLFLYGFVQLADFSNRIHVLIFWSTVSTFTLIVIVTAILWRHVSRAATLILKAIDLSARTTSFERPNERSVLRTRGAEFPADKSG
jgi:hypothetical protein